MWCFDYVTNHAVSAAAAREEKSITEVSRDTIPVTQFLDVLKKKRRKGTLAIEFKVGAVSLSNIINLSGIICI